MSDRLSALRSEIDLIDDQILKLVLSRLEICEAIFQVKQEENLALRDENRETYVMRRLQSQIEDQHIKELIENIFKEISSGCLKHQEFQKTK